MKEEVQLKPRLSPDGHEIERRRLWVAAYLKDYDVELADHGLAAFDQRFPTPNEVYFTMSYGPLLPPTQCSHCRYA